MEHINCSTAREIWISNNPKTIILIEENRELAAVLSSNYNGTVYSIDSIKGNEHLLAHMKCYSRNGKKLNEMEPYKPTGTLIEFLDLLNCAKVFEKDDRTLCVDIGESLFQEKIIKILLKAYYGKQALFTEMSGQLLWSNVNSKSELANRLELSRCTEAYVIGDVNSPNVLVVDSKDLQISDLLPSTSVVYMSEIRDEVVEGYTHIYSRGRFLCG